MSLFDNAATIEFGVECTRTIRNAGMRLSSYRGERSEEAFDDGWNKQKGIFCSTDSNPVRFFRQEGVAHRATHVKITYINRWDSPTDWIPITEELRANLAEFSKTEGWAKHPRDAEQWVNLAAHRMVGSGLIPASHPNA